VGWKKRLKEIVPQREENLTCKKKYFSIDFFRKNIFFSLKNVAGKNFLYLYIFHHNQIFDDGKSLCYPVNIKSKVM